MSELRRLNWYHSCLGWMKFISIKTSDMNRFYNVNQYRYQPQKLFITFSSSPSYGLDRFRIAFLSSLEYSSSWYWRKLSMQGEKTIKNMKLQSHEKLKTMHSSPLPTLRAATKFECVIIAFLSWRIFHAPVQSLEWEKELLNTSWQNQFIWIFNCMLHACGAWLSYRGLVWKILEHRILADK